MDLCILFLSTTAIIKLENNNNNPDGFYPYPGKAVLKPLISSLNCMLDSKF